MQIVIEISDELYKALLNGYEEPYSRQFSDCIRNGTPLPKGHGRLIDATNLFKKLFINQKGEIVPDHDADNFDVKYGVHYVKMAIHEAPTIIEADKEGENGD